MDIAAWLRQLGLERYEQAFRENEIDARSLPHLTGEDLKELGIAAIGHRRVLLQAIAELRGTPATEPASDAVEAPPKPTEAERRQLTVLFCDMVGSTELSARLDPEDLRHVMRTYQDACAAVLKRWDGHVAKYLGDGVLSYFGWPLADEDDAERAVRAGLELVAAVGRLTADGSALAARIGIATGQVVVGDLIGEGAALEEAVVGDTPNLAARLQALAEPGTVVIAPSTRRLLGGLFELVDLGPQRLKGFPEPLNAWRVVAVSGAESRFDALRGGRVMPLVGREHEIGLFVDRWERAKEGEGQVVLLSGEPGIGKSRIVRALHERLADESHIPLSHYCSPYYTNSALYPVIGLLERAAGFARDDGAEVRLDKLEALLVRGTEALGEVVPMVAALLEIETGERYPPLSLSPQRQKQRTLEVLVDQVEGLTAEPVLAIYEDVHWADPTTLEVLGLLIERVQHLPVLVVITCRPEFDPPWTGHAHVMQLSLSRLTRRHGEALVEKVTGGKALPHEVLDQIVGKTDGVPLFVEELTKTVLESGLLTDVGDHYALAGPVAPLAIPTTLQDSLMARLDRLAPVKEVAQIGAAIGREFSHELLAAVADRPENQLSDALDQLVSSELVFRRGTPPDNTYTFKHALVQDVAYQSLLKSKRQQLHTRIVQTLEERFPEAAETEPELLAHHCGEAGLAQEAVVYWQRAGQRALERSATVEAVAQLTKGLKVLESLPKTADRDRQELDLQIALGAALIATKGYAAPETGAAFEHARRLCDALGDRERLVPVLYGQTLFHMDAARHPAALQAAKDLLAIADGDSTAELLGHRLVGSSSMHLGKFLDARRHHEMALHLYDPERHESLRYSYAQDQRVTILAHLPWSLISLGYHEQGLVRGLEAVRGAKELNHPHTLAFALHAVSKSRQWARDAPRCRSLGDELLAVSAEHGFGFHRCGGWSAIGSAMLGEGSFADAERLLQQSVVEYRAAHAGYLLPLVLCELARAKQKLGKTSEALELVREGLALVERNEERSDEAPLLALRGESLLASCDGDRRMKAEASLHKAVEVARAQSARLFQLRAATSLACLWGDQGRRAEAHDLLAPIYGWFTEGFDTADLKEAKALLDELQ